MIPGTMYYREDEVRRIKAFVFVLGIMVGAFATSIAIAVLSPLL